MILLSTCELLKAVLQHETKCDRRVLRRRDPHLDAEIELEYRSATPEDEMRRSLLRHTRLPHKTVCGLLHPLIDPIIYCGAKLSSAWSLINSKIMYTCEHFENCS